MNLNSHLAILFSKDKISIIFQLDGPVCEELISAKGRTKRKICYQQLLDHNPLYSIKFIFKEVSLP